eukprot:Skav212020  [mRNA]  locus=scaffold984:119346:127605:+ [translate_table: standard]
MDSMLPPLLWLRASWVLQNIKLFQPASRAELCKACKDDRMLSDHSEWQKQRAASEPPPYRRLVYQDDQTLERDRMLRRYMAALEHRAENVDRPRNALWEELSDYIPTDVDSASVVTDEDADCEDCEACEDEAA